MKPSTRPTPVPDQRFVRLRYADQRPGNVTTTMTFLAVADGNTTNGNATGAADSTRSTDATGDGVLTGIAELDPGRAERIRTGMRQLIGHDDAVMRWLEADPANTALFATDPVTALRRALPDLPADFFDGWR